ncbi:hypothetical protein EDD75_0317 [Thermodesulfitimonas autotrophica]|uniref:Uncharacterized protein n=1 Tax=Thermodesulfitimonas autotrophica TaxID=1894989 RepID=A0A3N5C034_9THEO|nr:hypothetical protein [Thermodesulfitimonas autotrophica]RPF49501.1 hypothetical protein EDD75_0317 [Thermodesulfitimonas autotrophica]
MFKVLLFTDAREDAICIVDHNLSEAEARACCRALREQGLPAFIQKQKGRHRSAGAEACAACFREIEKLAKE